MKRYCVLTNGDRICQISFDLQRLVRTPLAKINDGLKDESGTAWFSAGENVHAVFRMLILTCTRTQFTRQPSPEIILFNLILRTR
jgi:hypothetical protein